MTQAMKELRRTIGWISLTLILAGVALQLFAKFLATPQAQSVIFFVGALGYVSGGLIDFALFFTGNASKQFKCLIAALLLLVVTFGLMYYSVTLKFQQGWISWLLFLSGLGAFVLSFMFASRSWSTKT